MLVPVDVIELEALVETEAEMVLDTELLLVEVCVVDGDVISQP